MHKQEVLIVSAYFVPGTGGTAVPLTSPPVPAWRARRRPDQFARGDRRGRRAHGLRALSDARCSRAASSSIEMKGKAGEERAPAGG